MTALAAPGILAPPAHAAPACPISYGSADSAKPNKLYLYFPTVADATAAGTSEDGDDDGVPDAVQRRRKRR